MTAGRLDGLLAKVDELPRKQARTSLVTRLKVFEKRLGEAEATLSVAQATEAFVVEVFQDDFPENIVPNVDDASKRATKAAKRLRKKLDEKIEFIADTKADDLLKQIGDGAGGARDAVTGAWKERVSQRIEALRRIAKVAKEAGLSGADGVVTRLQTLEKHPVPNTMAAAERARIEFTSVTSDVASLGLRGPAWDFVSKAILGEGRPKDLEDPDVRAFLDANRLWDRLSVKLG